MEGLLSISLTHNVLYEKWNEALFILGCNDTDITSKSCKF